MRVNGPLVVCSGSKANSHGASRCTAFTSTSWVSPLRTPSGKSSGIRSSVRSVTQPLISPSSRLGIGREVGGHHRRAEVLHQRIEERRLQLDALLAPEAVGHVEGHPGVGLGQDPIEGVDRRQQPRFVKREVEGRGQLVVGALRGSDRRHRQREPCAVRPDDHVLLRCARHLSVQVDGERRGRGADVLHVARVVDDRLRPLRDGCRDDVEVRIRGRLRLEPSPTTGRHQGSEHEHGQPATRREHAG